MQSSLTDKVLKEYQQVATNLALEAGKIMRQYFSSNITCDWKSDDTPITIADRRINQLVLDAIEKKYPKHSVIAEEGSRIVKRSKIAWVCDPLDGTIPFSKGYPTFVFSLALVKDGEPIIGTFYDPINDRLINAIKGKGAFLNDQKLLVSSEKKISKTSIIDLNTDLKLLRLREFLIKKKGCWVTELYSTCYACLLVATGNFLAELYEYTNPWDAAAAKVIIEEAGGKTSDINGNKQRYDQRINGFIASNGYVHKELLDFISTIKS